MKKSIYSFVLTAVIALTQFGCASTGTAPPEEIRQGKIEQITEVQMDENTHLGAGAIIGGIAGAGVGSLIGGGTGRDVAIAVGAIGGAVGGNYMQKKNAEKQPGQQIVVRLGNGVLVVVIQPMNRALFVGQRVYVQGSGQDATVLPQ